MIAIFALALVVVPSAAAGWGPVGSDPTSNYVPGQLPAACSTAPTGAVCVNAGIYYLDQARETYGWPAYKLPADFTSLTSAEQAFILTNLDRIQVGLPPVPGLDSTLDNVALTAGVQMDGDPNWTAANDPSIDGASANWAGWFDNIVLAYEAWMWDDGAGSPNIGCTADGLGGCWGHRHDILWDFGSNAVLAMGAAAGVDPNGKAGYAMLIAYGAEPGNGLSAGYTPNYVYGWSQAVADGAGTNDYDPGVPQITPVKVSVVVDGPGSVSDGSQTCSSTCTFDEAPGTAVSFTATPESGASFSGWSGQCSGSGACSFTPQESSSYTVMATFTSAPSTGGGGDGGGGGGNPPRLSIGIGHDDVVHRSHWRLMDVYLDGRQRGRVQLSVREGRRVLGKRTVTLGSNGAVVPLRTILHGKMLRSGRYALVARWQGRTFTRKFRVV